MLELKPWEFERLQPHGFYGLVKGEQWRQERQETLQAYWVSNVMNPHLKKPVAPKDLLRPLRPGQNKQGRSADEQYLREIFQDIDQ